MLGAVIGYLMLIRWWRKERNIYRTEWKVKLLDLGIIVSDHSSCQEVAKYKDEKVVVNRLRKTSVSENRRLFTEMATMKSLRHTNTTTFIGACVEPGNICTLWEYCTHGTLEDVLEHAKMKLGSTCFSFATDVCLGLLYLHSTKDLGYHGRLKSTNCLVDAHWVVKLSDFGIARLRKGEDQSGDIESQTFCKGLLWTAPERLRCILAKMPQKLTKESDIFSLGVVLNQIFCGNAAYTEDQGNPKDIVMKLAKPERGKVLMRPQTGCIQKRHRAAVALDLQRLIRSCWEEIPVERIKVAEAYKQIKRLWPRKKRRAFNKMSCPTNHYTAQLKQIFTDRTCHSFGKQESGDRDSVSSMKMSSEIRNELRQAKVYSDVTIGFYSLVDFSFVVCQSSPQQIVQILDQLQSHFESIIQNSDACVVETTGDAFMLASGCPVIRDDHATVATDAALTLQRSVDNIIIEHLPTERLNLRIGLHSGPVVASVVGKTKAKFCLFGQTVEIALRLESQGSPHMLHVSETTFQLLKRQTRFFTEQRGRTEIKGKEFIQTYWLKEK